MTLSARSQPRALDVPAVLGWARLRFASRLGFTPHSLRHAFASAMLSKGVPITDVAHWLGHRDVRVTFRIYGHLVPSAAARAIAVLDQEYAEWSQPQAA
jgi:integrase